MRYALALLAILCLAMPASAQWGNAGVQIIVPVPGGGGVSVGAGYNSGYYNSGYYNPGYNSGYYYNNGGGYYNNGGGYYNNGGCYNRGNYYNQGYQTYNRYPYTPYQQVWGGGGGGHHGRGRCR